MQMDAELVKEKIEQSSQVVIMAHRNLDLDALGSSLGIEYLCKTLDKAAYLLIEDDRHEVGVQRGIDEIRKQKINVKINTYEEIKMRIDNDTLLIIVDTHIPNLVQNKLALTIPNILVIDHHIINEENRIPSMYEYIGTNHPSTVSIIIDLLKQLDIYIHPYIATIMLAGIFIDTNGFFNKTTSRTHKEVVYLYKCGAQLEQVQYLLKEDIEKYNDRQQVIKEAKIINDKFIIATGHNDHFYLKEDLAKISDGMLLFNNIEASFAIGKLSEDVIGISARSLGNVNVQQIMEQLGGGGRIEDAATQIKNDTLDNVYSKLVDCIDKIKGGS